MSLVKRRNRAAPSSSTRSAICPCRFKSNYCESCRSVKWFGWLAHAGTARHPPDRSGQRRCTEIGRGRAFSRSSLLPASGRVAFAASPARAASRIAARPLFPQSLWRQAKRPAARPQFLGGGDALSSQRARSVGDGHRIARQIIDQPAFRTRRSKFLYSNFNYGADI